MTDGGVYLDDDGKFLIFGDKFDICGDCCASGGLQYTDDGRNVSVFNQQRQWPNGYPNSSDVAGLSDIGQTGGSGPDMTLNQDLSIGVKWRHHGTPRDNRLMFILGSEQASTDGKWYIYFKDNTDDASSDTGMRLYIEDENGTGYGTWINSLPTDDAINTLVFRWNNTTFTASVSLNSATFTDLVAADMSGVGDRTRCAGARYDTDQACFAYLGCYVQVNDLCTQSDADALASLSPNSALPTFWQDANHFYDFDEATRFAGTFDSGFAFFDQGTDASGWGRGGTASSDVTITDDSPYDDTLAIEASGRGVTTSAQFRATSASQGSRAASVMSVQSGIEDLHSSSSFYCPTTVFFRAYVDDWHPSGATAIIFSSWLNGPSSWGGQGGYRVIKTTTGSLLLQFRQGVKNAWATQTIDSGITPSSAAFATVAIKIDPVNLNAGISVNGNAFSTATLAEYINRGTTVLNGQRYKNTYTNLLEATFGHCISMYRYASDADALAYHNAACAGTLPTFMQNPHYIKAVLEFAEDATSDGAERRAYSVTGNMANYGETGGLYGLTDINGRNSPTLETYCTP